MLFEFVFILYQCVVYGDFCALFGLRSDGDKCKQNVTTCCEQMFTHGG